MYMIYVCINVMAKKSGKIVSKKMRDGDDEPAHLVNVNGGASPAQVPELGDHDTVSAPLQHYCTVVVCVLSPLVYTLLH